MTTTRAFDHTLPQAPGLEHTLAFFRDGYGWPARTADRLGTDVFAARLRGERTVWVRGLEAAHEFYRPGAFDRASALPRSASHLLQDEGSVQTLDGPAHEYRRDGFLAVLNAPASMDEAVRLVQEELGDAARRWRRPTDLGGELTGVLGYAAARWVGVPAERLDEARLHELWLMVVRAGSVGLPNWWARARRLRTESWARSLVSSVRDGVVACAPDSPLAAVARWTDRAGAPLPLEVAGVELLNLLRPFVAVALFVEMGLLAVAREPLAQQAADGGAFADLANEVRRRSPFFPVIGGRATAETELLGVRVESGQMVLLDLHGTNHHPRWWPEPYRFDPGRFARGEGRAEHIVAQGAGEIASGHRCPGEPLTQRLVESALKTLIRSGVGAVPDQDLRVDLSQLPARVRGGLTVAVR